MTKSQHCELIINAQSRKSRTAKKEVVRHLSETGFVISTTNEINKSNSIEDAIKAVINRKPELVIVGGGDGTISEVVDYLANTGIEIGIIPLGTTNNFARSLNIPLDLRGAVNAIKELKAKNIDLGSINGDYFSNVAGIGLSAEVANKVTNAAKRRWGRFAYAIVGLNILVKHKPFMVDIEDKDGELKVNLETHQVIIANGRYHAGKKIALDAKVDNRELLIFALGGRSKISFLWGMFDFYIGKRKNVSHASYLIARHVRLNTSTPQIVELDGEVKFETPITADIAPRAIQVRCKP